jgi:hypothetical protein
MRIVAVLRSAGVLALCTSCLWADATVPISFPGRRDTPVSAIPLSIAVADFNGDGKPDIAAATPLSILLGNGDATFTQSVIAPAAGDGGRWITTADFNRDGKRDLVAIRTAVSGNASEIVVLLGNGDGTFHTASQFLVNEIVGSLAVADFNGDGIPDLAIPSYTTNAVLVSLGNGDGAFRTPASYAAGGAAFAVVTGDFNGDGKPDLVTANETSQSVSVLLGNTDGSFRPATAITVGGQPKQIVVADLNRDSKADLAVLLTQGNVLLMIGNGAGSFTSTLSAGTGLYPGTLAIGDLNGDGIPDLVAGNSTSLMVMKGTGTGAMSPPAVTYPSPAWNSIALADVNADGKTDVVFAGDGARVSLYLGNGDGTLKGAIQSGSCTACFALTPGDFNGDGQLDIAYIDAGDTRFALGNGDGSFQPAVVVPYPKHSFATLASGDFNDDGYADLAALSLNNGTGATVDVALGSPTGLVPFATYPVPASGFFNVADVNADGRLDLYVFAWGGIQVLLGRGDGYFAPPVISTFPDCLTMTTGLADINGDGKPDLVAQGCIDQLVTAVGIGDGRFQAGVSRTVPTGANTVVAGDFNGDGKMDMLIGARTGPQHWFVLLGDGTGVFCTGGTGCSYSGQPKYLPALANTVQGGPVIGDFNNDGKLDVAFFVSNGGTAIYTGQGNGEFDPPAMVLGEIGAPTTGDFNNDGKLDLVGAGSTFLTLLNATAVGPATIIQSNPSGLTFDADGQTYVAPHTFLWTPSSIHTITWTSPQNAASGLPYTFYDWAGGAKANPLIFRVRPGGGTYTANFATNSLCNYLLTGGASLSAAGGSAAIMMSSSSWCAWASRSDSSWLAINVGSGNGNGLIAYTAAPNTTGASRTAQITSGFATFRVTQSASTAGCTSAITFRSLPVVDGSGGTGTLVLDAPAGCAWQTAASAAWALLSPSSGIGPGQLTWAIQPNPTMQARSVTLSAGTAQATVTQPGRSTCLLTLTPSGLSFGDGGGTQPVNVATDSTCAFSTVPSVEWLKILGQVSYAGAGMVNVVALPNTTGAIRYATVRIGDQTLGVLQNAGPRTSGARFVPITPCRIADTRFTQGTTGVFGPGFLPGQQTRDFPVPLSGCYLPGTAQAYSLNITAVPYGPLGFLTAWPQGQAMPLASNLNSPKGTVVANAAIVPAGWGGGISIYASDPTDVIVDVNGYFTDPAAVSTLAFYPVTPCRVMDTRAGQGAWGSFGPPSMPTGGSSRVVPVPSSQCGVPPTAAAYSVNFTVVPTGKLGYLSAWPTGQAQPVVSTLNSWDGAVLANAAIVPAGIGGAISVFTWLENGATTDVIMDINGYFAAPGGTGGLSLYPMTPCRVVDTRSSEGKTGAFGPPSLSSGAPSRTFPIPAAPGCGVPATAQAYALNATVVPTGYLGYLSIWPAGQPMPVVSTLNSWDGRIVANFALVPAGANGAVNAYTFVGAGAATDVVLDISGYFAQ